MLFATTGANNAAGHHEHLDVRPLTGALAAEVFVDLDSFSGFAARWGEFGDDPFVEGLESHPPCASPSWVQGEEPIPGS